MSKKKEVISLGEKLRDDFGKLTFSNGAKYEGEWKDGEINGQGSMIFENGGKFQGEWKDGKSNGQGTLTLSIGSKYVGEWKDDKEWNGTDYDKNGNITGKWVNGNPTKQ